MSLSLWEYLSQKAKFYCPPVTGSQNTTTNVLAPELAQLNPKKLPQFAIRNQGMIDTLLNSLQEHIQNQFITPEQKNELDRRFQPLLDRNGTHPFWTVLSKEADVRRNNLSLLYALHTDYLSGA